MSASSADLSRSPQPAFAFGEFRLEPDGMLFRANEPIHLPPKELAALRLLLERAGSVITPAELKRAIWGDVHVTGDSVLHCISSLRGRLGADERILTVYKRGYRFGGAVRRLAAAAAQLPRLAVVPFDCAPGVPAELGELIAEETTASLTTSAGAVVSIVARDSVFILTRRGLTAQEVGGRLQADLVLAGTLRALPAHLRVRAEMVRVRDGAQIWVEEMFVDRESVAGLHSILAARVASRMRGEILAVDGSVPSAIPVIRENGPGTR